MILVTHELPDIVPEIQRVVLMAGASRGGWTEEEILQVERLRACSGSAWRWGAGGDGPTTICGDSSISSASLWNLSLPDVSS